MVPELKYESYFPVLSWQVFNSFMRASSIIHIIISDHVNSCCILEKISKCVLWQLNDPWNIDGNWTMGILLLGGTSPQQYQVRSFVYFVLINHTKHSFLLSINILFFNTPFPARIPSSLTYKAPTPGSGWADTPSA